ncbi:Limonene-1,2-epoxide hydrolase [Nocardia otitidiscaviarum]|uniref:Epoxide hydrolase n=1 Tax=Nocardia otitidiscaviarum TaxID=1823 RepID=A0A378YA16_9NOCA|nr:limonene-1,2-epoxide hydrolase family protein [Nocardia otitidiscaviarum]MBF6482832.1 nuclear transport factor 2 family protein [Nocardia otitidiscaviarum]MCP9623127.1 nuclear transport factor 2 family protein [Nocardia otitidiscaviarum]QDP77785.1 epoxide hydrolase [Nocardia otitidiscaviarum]SUA73209.1 Limonene-1,2-epoxide hydrolase [Nocardia otitidiscaviarum]
MSDLPELRQDAVTTVREFFAALEVNALDEAMDLVHPGIVWKNTSLPDVRGADRVRWVLNRFAGPRYGFRADMHHVAATEDGVVLTERTDYLRVGSVEVAFWVCGTFEFVDGRIFVWHDHFSWENFVRGTVVGVARALFSR